METKKEINVPAEAYYYQQGSCLNHACFFYGLSYLPILRKMKKQDISIIKSIASECNDISMGVPLQHEHNPVFSIPSFHPEKKLTGLQVLTVMVLCLYLLIEEDAHSVEVLDCSFPWLSDLRNYSPLIFHRDD